MISRWSRFWLKMEFLNNLLNLFFEQRWRWESDLTEAAACHTPSQRNVSQTSQVDVCRTLRVCVRVCRTEIEDGLDWMSYLEFIFYQTLVCFQILQSELFEIFEHLSFHVLFLCVEHVKFPFAQRRVCDEAVLDELEQEIITEMWRRGSKRRAL